MPIVSCQVDAVRGPYLRIDIGSDGEILPDSIENLKSAVRDIAETCTASDFCMFPGCPFMSLRLEWKCKQ